MSVDQSDDTSNHNFITPDAGKVERLKKEIAITDGLSAFFKAMADDTRLKVIHALSLDELCVCDVADVLGSSVQAASHHLRILRNTGLAKYRREGKKIFYSLSDRKTAGLVQKFIADLIEREK
mgnify:CR=1 FL=1|jgi:DNA-binding transcriptional ArsR family regulator